MKDALAEKEAGPKYASVTLDPLPPSWKEIAYSFSSTGDPIRLPVGTTAV